MEACHSFRTQWIEAEDFQWFGDLLYDALSLICFNLYFRKNRSVYTLLLKVLNFDCVAQIQQYNALPVRKNMTPVSHLREEKLMENVF